MARKAACLPKGTRISDYVTLGVLTATVPGDLIDAVLSDTGKQSQRYRQLPARLVIYYVMALVLFAQASYGEVLRCLLEGVRWLHLKGESTALASKSAITKARIRLGVAPLKEVFERVARPLAEPGLAGAFYRGLRLVSLDGTTILVPDEPQLEQRFGRPSSSPAAFRQARLLALMESGTHAIFAAAIGRYDTSEVALAPALLERVRPRILAGFGGLELWQAARAPTCCEVQSEVPVPQAAARLLVPEPPSSGPHRRQRAVVVRLIEYHGVPDAEPLYRLITTLLDPESAPAAELAALYHERWEQEGAFAELKVTLPGGQLMLRSRRADLAEQELYALLLVHLALRGLMVEASRKGGCDPDTLSFIHAVRVVRRHLPFHAAFLLTLPFGSPSAAPTHG